MQKRDYYDVLGVAKSADARALKSAYRKLALKHHPDQNPDDKQAESCFKEVGEAYAILSDPEKRAAYDRLGHAAFEGGGPGNGSPFGHGDPGDVFQDIFSQVFGGASPFGNDARRATTRRGNDLRYDMEITLEEAFHGKDTLINVPGAVSCGTCSGTGAAPGSSPQTCNTCGGAGRVRTNRGFFMMEQTCVRCAGRGQTISRPCRPCRGRGQVQEERKLAVKIPPGVETGMRIRLSGEGEPGTQGEPKGDLYIFVTVADHDIFERDGLDLYCRTPVSVVKAALGEDIELPTINGGRARVAIPEGAQTGRKLRLRGKGMPDVRSSGHVGDLYIELFVETPRNLSVRQKEILREFCDHSGGNCNPESESFIGRVRKFWDGLGEDVAKH